MHRCRLGWRCAVSLAAVAFATSAVVAPAVCTGEPLPLARQAIGPPLSASGEPLETGDLIYREAPVTFHLDVNGAAAVQLIGPVLDAAADVARGALPSLMKVQPQARGRGVDVMALLAYSVPPLIDPAKDAIKSITHLTLVAMKPGDGLALSEVQAYYNELMTRRGWRPLATLRTGSEEGLLLLLAPGGKGLFGVLRPNQRELVVGMVTTSKPLGDLVAQVLRAGGPQLLRTFTAVR